MTFRKVVKRVAPYCLILAAAACLMLHAQYSFCQSDESFYLSLVNRLYQGDRLIVDEWHPTQFYAPALLPLYAVFRVFSVDGDGMILFFRLMYLLFACGTGLLVVKAFRPSCGPWFAAAGALMLMLYSRANISGMSYYNLCVQFAMCAVSLAALGMEAGKKMQGVLGFAAGVCMAGMVLCCPYLAVAVVLGLPVLLENKRTRPVAAWAICGIAVSAAVYVIFFLNQITMEELTVNLNYILNDPQHTQTLNDKWIKLQGQAEPFFTLRMLQIIAAFSGVVLVCRLVKGSMPGWLWLGYLLFAAAVVYRSILGAKDNICFVFYLPFSHCMIPVVLHSMLTKGCRKLHLVFFLGLAMSVAFCLASNTVLCAMTTGYAIASAAAIMLIPSVIRSVSPAEKKSVSRVLIRVAALGIFVMLLGTAGAHRFLGFYRDAPIEQLTVRLEEGPAAGLLTSEENARQYNEIYEIIRTVQQENPEAYVFHTAKTPWAYLCGDWHYGAHTAWTTQLDSQHLADYYELNKEKMPNYVFIYPPQVGAYQSVPYNDHKEDLAPNANHMYGTFYNTVVRRGKKLIEAEFVTVYQLRQ